eukprot:113557-Pyramimonas_sp.AAC.1
MRPPFEPSSTRRVKPLKVLHSQVTDEREAAVRLSSSIRDVFLRLRLRRLVRAGMCDSPKH